MLSLLAYDPERRMTAQSAREHAYFTVEKPRPKEEAAMPSFKPTQEQKLVQRTAPQPQAVQAQAEDKYAGSIFGAATVNYDAYLAALDAEASKAKKK